MNNFRKKVVFSFLICFFSFLSFAQIINPVKGEWANKQSLVIELEEGDSAFYSINGQNPETSGFAYDGPVLLDIEGNVALNVLISKASGEKHFEEIKYSVNQKSLPENETVSSFLSKIKNLSIYEYVSGDNFEIPADLKYSFNNNIEDFEQGKTLFIQKNSIVSRFLPVNLKLNDEIYRTVLKIKSSASSTYSRNDVPFKISDWETVNFSDTRLLFKIDDEYWKQFKKPLKIDRSKSHMISWQNIDFKIENPVNYFVLPEKPSVKVDKDSKGVTQIYFENADSAYKFGIIQENGEVSELFDSVCIDTFDGDFFTGSLALGIFYDSVYQGLEIVDFAVYKKSPQKPKFISSENQYISRKSVKVQIQAENSKEIYYNIFGPVELKTEDYSKEKEILLKLDEGAFKKYLTPVILDSKSENACLYKISAYSIDKYDQKSLISDYSVVIDKSNYYIDSKYSGEKSDGSQKNPFKTFEECIPFINQSNYSKIKIFGEVTVPAEKVEISSNCKIFGDENSKLIMKRNSSFDVRNSSLTFENILINHQGFNINSTADYAFSVKLGALDFINCEVVVPFSKNGMVIKSEKSVVNVNNSGITVSSDSYNSICSALDSKIGVKNSRLSGISNTSVLFSIQGGTFELLNSNCKIICDLGRICELFDCDGIIKDNILNCELSSEKRIKAIYTNSDKVYFDEETNQLNGFIK